MHSGVRPDPTLLEVGSAYLQTLGADSVAHSSRTLTEHLHGTHALLSVWKQPEPLCIAGLLHSLYATASGAQLLPHSPTREAITLRFGAEIERLVFGYSRYQRRGASDAAPHDAQQDQLAIIYLANLVDQTIFLPRQFVSLLQSHHQRVRPGLPTAVATWMDDFMPLLRGAL